MRSKIGYAIVVVVLLISCNIKPEPIVYGTDGCHFCSMTIVDKQHAAELVTRKGKVFKFDATECMMNHLAKGDMETIALFLVNDYNNPGTLIDATKATYLISENIPSPMGAYLSAFRNIEMAELASSAEKDMLMNWGELQEKYWQ